MNESTEPELRPDDATRETLQAITRRRFLLTGGGGGVARRGSIVCIAVSRAGAGDPRGQCAR